jgi:Zn ribbon nucleic-acid-binding protein
MTLAQGISTIGFRKWYERQLLRGHAHLILVLAGVLVMMMALEAANRFATPSERWLDWTVAAAAAVGAMWALRRYLFLLMKAEHIANQANCPHCKTYGRLTLVTPNPEGDDIDVRCRHCGHVWRMFG